MRRSASDRLFAQEDLRLMKKLVALLMTVLLLNVFAGCSQADEIPDDPNQYVYSYDDSSAGDAAENTLCQFCHLTRK